MEMNVFGRYASQTSPPASDTLTFYSKQCDDLIFPDGADIVIYCRSSLRAVSMKWTLCKNLYVTPYHCGNAEALPANCFIIRLPSQRLAPGFYDLHVCVDDGDRESQGICTFGYRPDRMETSAARPADFYEFWETAKERLASIPLNSQETYIATYRGKQIDDYNQSRASIPADHDPEGHACDAVELYKVSFQGIGGVQIHAWLAKPAGNGQFRGMLVLPGAGIAARPAPLEHARHGYLALDIQIHGQEVDQQSYGALPGYYDAIAYNPPQMNYYYNVYLNCIQAVNYLFSRTDVLKSGIAAVGGSQGGRLAAVTAALDKRIIAALPAILHFANIPYLKESERANNEKRNSPSESAMSMDTPEARCAAYYDVANFAQDIECPVFMNAGLIDPISPPTGVYAVYNRISSEDKTIVPMPGLAHDWSAEFDRRAWRWLDGVLSGLYHV